MVIKGWANRAMSAACNWAPPPQVLNFEAIHNNGILVTIIPMKLFRILLPNLQRSLYPHLVHIIFLLTFQPTTHKIYLGHQAAHHTQPTNELSYTLVCKTTSVHC